MSPVLLTKAVGGELVIDGRLSKLFLLGCLALPAFGQSETPASQPAGNMTLDVVAVDKSGKPVSGLQESDFSLLDNKHPQKILSFQAMGTGAVAPTPTEALIVLDAVNTPFQFVSLAREQLDKFFKENGGELALPTTLVLFTDRKTQVGGAPTRDGKMLAQELDTSTTGLRTINRSQGFYGAGDRVQLSIDMLQKLIGYEASKPGRKLVIWISPGWPLLTGPRVELTSKTEQGLFHTIVMLSGSLRRADITLYSVDPFGTSDSGGLRTTYYEEFRKGVKAPKGAQIGNIGLQVLAEQTGGRALYGSNDVATEIKTCISDASSYYVLTFDASPGDGPNDYHALEVKIDKPGKPGLTAHTRTGYYAQAEH